MVLPPNQADELNTLLLFPQMAISRETGALGERIAAEFLEKKGFRLIGRNYRKPWGEIDIIARRGTCTHFVEVKTVSREIGENGVTREPAYDPEEQAHASKLTKLSRVVETYVASEKVSGDYQIDVVAVVLDPKRRIARCVLYEQVL